MTAAITDDSAGPTGPAAGPAATSPAVDPAAPAVDPAGPAVDPAAAVATVPDAADPAPRPGGAGGADPRPAPGALPYDHRDPVMARVTWSRLAEPADKAAAVLVAGLGPVAALDWVLEQARGADGAPPAALDPPLPAGPDPARAAAAWAGAVARWMPRLEGLDLRRELETLERLGGSLVVPGDPWWPPGLDELEQPPFCLWVRGDPALLAPRGEPEPGADRPPPGRQDRVPAGPGVGLAVALVGSRASTAYGEGVARDLGRELAARGVLIVSGGAYGIDAAAHRGAQQGGRTLSVSAGGVDRLYPAGNAGVLEEIVTTGALVAEVPPGCQPGRHRFLSRNRLIAAMTGGTVVVEAAWRSGALSTARHARDLGRELGAVPGPVTSMASAGCHRLLREGAVCVTDADEVLELIGPLGAGDPDALKARRAEERGGGLLDGLDELPAAVLDAMPARGATGAAAIARAAGLSEREVVSALGLLELAGRVGREGESWRRARASDRRASSLDA